MEKFISFFNNVKYIVQNTEDKITVKKVSEIYERDTLKNKLSRFLHSPFMRVFPAITAPVYLTLGGFSLATFLEFIMPVWGWSPERMLAGAGSSLIVALITVVIVLVFSNNRYIEMNTAEESIDKDSEPVIFEKLWRIKDPNKVSKFINDYFNKLNEEELSVFVENVLEFRRLGRDMKDLDNILEVFDKDTLFADDGEKQSRRLAGRSEELRAYFDNLERQIVTQSTVSELLMNKLSSIAVSDGNAREKERVLHLLNHPELEEVYEAVGRIDHNSSTQ